MSEDQIIEDYLARVIHFREKKALQNDYLPVEKRDHLVDELIDSLDFEPHLQIWRKGVAARFHFLADKLSDDRVLGEKAGGTQKYYAERFARKAIALDPFNETYLKFYLFSNSYLWKRDATFSKRLLNLNPMGSTDFQNAAVDLGLSHRDSETDYLSDDVIHPLVDAMVFLKKESEIHPEKSPEEMENLLRKMASDAGVDDLTLQEISKEVKDQVDVVDHYLGDHWRTWSDGHKAWLAVESAIHLAPFNMDVLSSAVRFYGGEYWRLILGYAEVKESADGTKNFYQSVFGTRKPSRAVRLAEAEKGFKKALELEKRMQYLMAANPQEEKKHNHFHWQEDYVPVSRLRRMWHLDNKDGDKRLLAFMDEQQIAFKALTEHFRLKTGELKLGVLIGIPLSGLIIWLAYFVMPFMIGITFPIFLAVMAVMGILHLREYLWKKRPIEIADEELM